MDYPFWKIAYKFGITLTFRVVIHKDNENKVYWCKSPDLPGLIAKMPTIEGLIKEVNIIAEELLELNYNLKPRHTKFFFSTIWNVWLKWEQITTINL